MTPALFIASTSPASEGVSVGAARWTVTPQTAIAAPASVCKSGGRRVNLTPLRADDDAMRLRVTMAAALSSAALAAPAVGATADEPSVFLRAAAALQEEADLVPRVAPHLADQPGYSDNRARLQDVDKTGARYLRTIEEGGVDPSPVLRQALGLLPVPVQGAAPPPTPSDYGQAIDELRQFHTEYGSWPDFTELPGEAGKPAPTSSAGAVVLGMGGATLAGAIGLTAAWWIRRRRRDTSELLELAMTDALTGAGNRRRFDADTASLAAGPPADLSVVMIDVDHFKQVNDQHGHAAGDEVLRRVAATLRAQLRPTDAVYRYGGEEFCAVLCGAHLPLARHVAERMRAAVAAAAMPTGGRVTISVGVATGTSETLDATIERADSALYKAKGAGRDRVETFSARHAPRDAGHPSLVNAPRAR